MNGEENQKMKKARATDEGRSEAVASQSAGFSGALQEVDCAALPAGLENYRGAKGGEGVWQTIISQMPPHETYIEPFLGSGTILRLKRPATCSIGIDADPMVVGYWQRWQTVFNRGTLLPDTDFNRTNFICGDGIRFLQEYRWKGAELVYADPPYLMSTRSCQRDYYRKEFSDEDHFHLLAVLKTLPCPVLLSGYWSFLYDTELQDWHLTSFRVMTHRGPATECLWRNFAAPLALHDYRFLGANFRERERIKRKKLRWQARLSKMPPLEKAALIAAVNEMEKPK